MLRILTTLVVATLFAAPLEPAGAQDVLYYKFDAGGGRKVVNYYGHSGIAPLEARLVSQNGYANSTLWATGNPGSALKGSETVGRDVTLVSDCYPQHAGSFTIAFAFKNRRVMTRPSRPELVTAGGGSNLNRFICFINSQANNNLGFEGWASVSSPATLQTTPDVLTPHYSRWVHVAAVFDNATRSVRYYVDGQLADTLSMGNYTARIQAGENPLRIGFGSRDGSVDIDEFRLLYRAATASEVQAWAQPSHFAADGRYGRACYPRGRSVLLESNRAQAGLPTPGNGRYALKLYGPVGSTFQLALGTSRTRLFSLPLPLDLAFVHPALSGCVWEADADIALLPGAIGATGEVTVPLPIPNVAALAGFRLYSQALLTNTAINTMMTSNGFSVIVGR